jgi:uncharacterized Tic20 family protein
MEDIEYLGFIATLFILASFLLDGNKLRLINIVGAILWFAYGLVTMSTSIMFLNVCVVLIHLFKLSYGRVRRNRLPINKSK